MYRYGNDSPFGASSSTGLRQALRLQLEVTLKYHCRELFDGVSPEHFGFLSTSSANVFSNDKLYATPSALAIDYRRGFLTPQDTGLESPIYQELTRRQHGNVIARSPERSRRGRSNPKNEIASQDLGQLSRGRAFREPHRLQ